MRKLLPLALLLALAGCKKPTVNVGGPAPNPQQPAQPGQPAVHAPTGVVINPNLGGGGSGGAAQAVRKAVKRSATQNDLHNLHLFINTYSSANGQMPSLQTIAAALQKEAPNISKLWEEKVIAVTGATQRESVWAYTVEPVSVTGEHLTVTNNGVERMSRQDLEQRLKEQR